AYDAAARDGLGLGRDGVECSVRENAEDVERRNPVVDIPIALAVGAGMLATVNPCGFAMLPAYVAFFVGVNGDDHESDRNPVGRALLVTAAVTVGFIVVFAVIGLLVTQVTSTIEDHLPWVTIAIGVTLVGLGGYLLSGRELVVSLPKLERGGGSTSLPSMVVFGISYAIASLSCTLPVFLTTLVPTFRSSGVLAGLATFVFYGLGMGLVLGVVTIAIALARVAVVQRLRRALPYVSRASGGLLAVAGAYVAYYGWWEVRGDFDADPIIDGAADVQSWLAERVDNVSRGALVLVLVLATVAAIVRARRRHAAAASDVRTPTEEKVPT
ncbi:MAG TPA: cytochrome c biogenesis CcdA family protein, partial [Acidimicrobiia bacterium]|nr:cytochrome c biogenesis CcdA family protein [Acidimicrobiia bacterium]